MASRRVSLFIGAFLALQIAAPLDYYACRDDERDERFAWRMFSPQRMSECTPRFWLSGGDRPREAVRLNNSFHQAWIRTARRGRVEVVRRMALSLCDDHPERQVRVELSCTDVDGEVETITRPYDVCLTGAIQ